MRSVAISRAVRNSLAGCCVVLVVACASTPVQPDSNQQDRRLAYQKWSNCLTFYLDELNDDFVAPNQVIDETMTACHGYQNDLVALYPASSARNLHEQLSDQAVRQGIRTLLIHHNLIDGNPRDPADSTIINFADIEEFN